MAVMFRATYFFKDSNGYGWTETIHSNKPDYPTMLQAAKDLIPWRRDLLGTTAFLNFVRISDDLVRRDSMIYVVPPGDGTTRISSATASAIANTNLVVRLDATPLIRRTLYMRGVPDDVEVRSGVYAPVPGYANSVDAWLQQLVDDGWCCRSKDPALQQFTITGITQDPANGRVTITTSVNHNISQNTAFTIKGVASPTWLNGNWNAFGATATTITIATNNYFQAWGGGGLVARIGFVLTRITGGEVRRVSHRIAGRPFDSPRGRRRKTTRR